MRGGTPVDDVMRRNLPLFPIGIVQRLTDLTARQIRYYEQHELIHPQRTEGNQRLFSFRDVESLLEIKNLIDKGLNIAGIKTVINQVKNENEYNHSDDQGATRLEKKHTEMTDVELHQFLLQELVTKAGYRGNAVSTIQGELSRFFKQGR